MNVYADAEAVVHHGDALEALAALPANSIDAVVTDPPYGLEFMGHAWDSFGTGRLSMMQGFEQWCRGWAIEALRVLKPGGHLLAFGGSRTWHRLAAGVEDAGFELRDSIAWLYGQGFPKSKSVDAAMAHYVEHGPTPPESRVDRRLFDVTRILREARNRLGWTNERIDALFGTTGMAAHWCAPSSQPMVPSVAQWERLKAELGIGDDLDGLVAELGSVELGPEWGNGPINSDWLNGVHGTPSGVASGWGTALKPGFEPCVVARKPLAASNLDDNVRAYGTGALHIDAGRIPMSDRDAAAIGAMSGFGVAGYVPTPSATYMANSAEHPMIRTGAKAHSGGRWPTNVVLDVEAAAALGDASRFFYVSKAPRSERPRAWAPSCDCEHPWPTTSPARATDDTTEAGASSTSKSGSENTAPSPTGTTSTTSTATSSTTPAATFGSSPGSSTSGSTADASSGVTSGGSRATSAAPSSPSVPPTGTSTHEPGGSSTGAADRATSASWSSASACGRCGKPAHEVAHATVKPLALMRHLVALVTPPGGIVLDPFAGSGSTLEATLAEGFRGIAIERQPEYLPLILQRLERARG